jgi:hypothetical protein
LFLPFLVAGLVLRLTSGWFAGQHTIGDILLVVCAVLLALQLLMLGGFVTLWKKF